MTSYLASLNTWGTLFSISGLTGIVLAVVGTVLESTRLTNTGIVLIAPIIILGGLLLGVVIPLTIFANRGKRG